MSLWKKDRSVDDINEVMHKDTLMHHLGITITDCTDTALIGTMPVDKRTLQPFGILHGGASVALAETLGSMAAWMALPEHQIAVGMDIQANHFRPVTSGTVTGKATPLHLGKTTQVWDIAITNEDGKLVCASRINMAIRDA